MQCFVHVSAARLVSTTDCAADHLKEQQCNHLLQTSHSKENEYAPGLCISCTGWFAGTLKPASCTYWKMMSLSCQRPVGSSHMPPVFIMCDSPVVKKLSNDAFLSIPLALVNTSAVRLVHTIAPATCMCHSSCSKALSRACISHCFQPQWQASCSPAFYVKTTLSSRGFCTHPFLSIPRSLCRTSGLH